MSRKCRINAYDEARFIYFSFLQTSCSLSYWENYKI